jgi:hypothetical protein
MRPLRQPSAQLLRLSGERPLAVNAARVLVYTFRTPCVCLQRRVIRTLQQPLDSGTTATRTFAVVPIHSEVNRLGHSD